jgi:hypothetical protein
MLLNPKYTAGYESLQAALELRTVDPIYLNLKQTGYEHSKVFLYSKVINAMSLAAKAKLNFKPEPWMHCIAVKDEIVAYIWDSREIVFIDKNPTACKALQDIPFDKCIIDHYSAFWETPILLNSFKVAGGDAIMKIAETWVEPRIQISYYRNIESKQATRKIEFDINIHIPARHPKIKKLSGQVYVGNYVCTEVSNNKYQSELDIDLSLIRDIYPSIPASAKSDLSFKKTGVLNYLDIQNALCNALIK